MVPQRLIPGLVGMATPANAVYLRALQSADAEAQPEASLNRLQVVLFELDFAQFVEHVRSRQWQECERRIAAAARSLRAAGAGFLVITSNTGSTFAGLAREETGLPVLDIVDVSLARLQAAGCRRAGLLSTQRTLQSGVYQAAARARDVEILAPAESVMAEVERVIFQELIYGRVTTAGLSALIAAAQEFERQSADSLLLACTDMTHLAEALAKPVPLQVFDTTVLHAAAAARAARSGSVT